MKYFDIAPGYLTTSGQRMRYLLGRYNRDRYINKYDFLTPDFEFGEVYIQSTDVERTITSGYSEIMGLYPPHESRPPRLTEGQRDALESGRSAPPFKVRDENIINPKLKWRALPNGFTSIPVYSYDLHDPHDDLQ